VSKRTGKTHENLESQATPPPTVTPPPRARSVVARPPRGDRSGPIGISGGDFATPTARKRTTTQPRGLPVVGAAPAAPTEPPAAPTNGTPTPPPVARIEGAQPESPFTVPATGEVGDAASQLAAEAAAVRALDSGPLTPPPTLDDPGPTPPPVIAEPVAAIRPVTPPPIVDAPPPESPAVEQPFVEPPLVAQPSAEDRNEQVAAELPAVAIDVPAADEPSTPAFSNGSPGELTPRPVVDAALDAVSPEPLDDSPGEDRFAAQETPWPELGAHTAKARTATPTPGAIPTDAMGGDSGAASDPAVASAIVSDAAAIEAHASDVADDLELDESAETLDALPAEALADPGPAPSNDLSATSVTATPPPTPRAPPAPPPIPSGTPRRKTGEVRPAEVPTAQVVASLLPEAAPGAPPLPEALAQRPRRPKRSKPWFEEVFDEDYLRTLPFMSADQTLREVEFIEASLGLRQGARVLDIGCGYGRHAIELVQRGLDVTGLDLSLPLLIRAADEAQKRAMSVNFVHADMREMAFEQQFDGAYSMMTSFGYFDEEANLRAAEGIARALKPGARFLLDIVNRDYVVGDLPSRVWWEGNGCVVLEEVDFNFHTSRILTHRSIVFEDGRQLEQEISVRAYSLHEIGRLLRQAGFRVLDISGSLATRGHFFGGTSRSLLILAEKRAEETP
jgi:SAM-dependent methyltransferase